MEERSQITQFIGKHLPEKNLKLKIYEVDDICAFTGSKIGRGVKLKDLIKPTFTDISYLKHVSDYASIEAALCIESVVDRKGKKNSLRNYSYMVTESCGLVILHREDIENLVFHPPDENFVLCVTYSNKKHTSFKSTINTTANAYVVTTDIGNVFIEPEKIANVYSIMKRWYTIVPEKAGTSAQPTFFNKHDVLTGCENMNKIRRYGINAYFEENKLIETIRSTSLIILLTHILNKGKHDKVGV